MKPLRTVLLAGVVGTASLGSGLFVDLLGVPDHVASGQTMMARGPSILPAASGYASTPSYNMPGGHQRMPAYNPATGYAPQAAPMPYGLAAYPASGYGPTHAQPIPYQVPHQPANMQPAWPYVHANDGQASVMRGRGELLGGPPLAAPQVQLPTPSPHVPHNYTPLQQSPYLPPPMHQMPLNQMPGQPTPEYAMPGYAMPGYSYGAGTCDAWGNCDAAMYEQPVVRNWFGSVGAVVMTRDRADHYTFSFGTGNEADQRTNTRDAAMDWDAGFDVRFGRYFNCRQNAVEAVYWGLFPDSQSTQTTSADVVGQLNGILNWNSLNYGGSTADVFVNVAPGEDGIHRLTRDFSFHNIELNFWHFCGSCGPAKCDGSRLRHNWLAGVRYFRFDENLLFASDADDWQITYANDEIFYNIDIENHLIGLQLGSQTQYCMSDRLTADLGIKFGVFANRINHISEIGGNLGVATINNGPFTGRAFFVDNSKNDVAFLGELNLGLRYGFNCRWTGTLGYRALAVTGVAMPADQIYPDLRGINDVENIDSSRALILHGVYSGLEYNW
ncbi:MAG: BBP7 family outer membrane beta-barrel protein [Pirellulaceae bacterium]